MPTPIATTPSPPATPVRQDPFAFESVRERLRRRLIETTAQLCEARSLRRVVLVGAAADVWPVARQPWLWSNVQVVAALSEARAPSWIRGVPVIRRGEPLPDCDALVVVSDDAEHHWASRAAERAAASPASPRPVLRPFHSDPAWEPEHVAERRLIESWNTPRDRARWLIANRAERHDATLPMLLPSRTELHLRRYEFAAAYTHARRVADIACGLGYGSRILTRDGAAASVDAFDISEEAIAYARARFAAPGVTFRVADGAATGLPNASVDVVTSFETIEHVPDPRALLREFARVLLPSGLLVLSTPNDWGLTQHHVHSFTPDSLRAAVQEHFDIQGWWSQHATSQRLQRDLPEGIASHPAPDSPAETLLLVARRR